jgi:5'-nucleotidase
MHILVSNDDGYQAPGLLTLVDALAEIARVTVVAPERDRSGASNSLTLDNPLRAVTHDNGFVSVDGTPTDCVHLAITGLLVEEPDMVVSGINAGANLGDDVLYSGTVAAATEGRFLGLPAMAVSLVGTGFENYASAARVVVHLISNMRAGAIPPDTILNINIPDVPWKRLRGFRLTRLGHRHKSEPVIRDNDPRGRPIYWVGPAGAEQDAGEETDFHAVREGYISITPLQVDLTRHAVMGEVAQWLEGIDLP